MAGLFGHDGAWPSKGALAPQSGDRVRTVERATK
jgi:hypothetical protein